MKRPSPKELYNKLKDARNAAANGNMALLNQSVVACDAIDLDYAISDELLTLVPEFFGELSPRDYVGLYPPQRSYEAEIKGLELFAFKARSTIFGNVIYIKFALDEGFLWLISFHHHRPRKENP